MENKLRERLLGNGLFTLIKRAFSRIVTTESSITFVEEAAADASLNNDPSGPFMYEEYKRNRLEAERQIAQAYAEAQRALRRL